MSAPAFTWLTAICAKCSSVLSLSTYPPSVSIPQCPWLVYSHIHTSVTTFISGSISFIFLTALWIIPSSLYASLPQASFSWSCGIPNSITCSIPKSFISFISSSNISNEKWYTSGKDDISRFIFSPSTINKGYIKSSIFNLVSLTKFLVALFILSLLGLLNIYFSSI